MPSILEAVHASERHEKRKREKNDPGEVSQKRKRRSKRSEDHDPSFANHEPAENTDVISTPQDLPLDAASPQKLQLKPQQTLVEQSPWKILEPMGGRMVDIDPVFSADEKYLIITYNTSIQVYSTEDSLLVRRIPLSIATPNLASGPNRPFIVASALSQVSPSVIWVACSDGRVWRVDWTTGTGTDSFFRTKSQSVLAMAVNAVQLGETLRDIIFASERNGKASSRIIAYDVPTTSNVKSKELQTHAGQVTFLRVPNAGGVLVGAAKNTVIVASLKERDLKDIEDLTYVLYSFDINDDVASLSVRCTSRDRGSKKKHGHNSPVLDLALGGARGAVMVYGDLLARLKSAEGTGSGKHSVRSRTHHWHQRAVHAVAWSEDGNYLISGGSEAVLVIYQIDTGKQDFLPHLSASVENIVVSPGGASYAVHLDDNSTMILSTAEMKALTYISGLQSLVFTEKTPKDNLVRRVWQGVEEISQPVAAAVDPRNPSHILLSVGNGQQGSLSGLVPALPMLQSFDLGAFQSISKQALARTNVTHANHNSKGYPITEPTVTQMAFSRDGQWLATIDEWEPPQRDVVSMTDGSKVAAEFSRERREIHLKFWNIDDTSNALDLASRIVGPHFSHQCETVFGLATDKASTRFATIGDDGVVRIWNPRTRTQNGLVTTGNAGQTLTTWSCTRAVSLGESIKSQDELLPQENRENDVRSGAITFSDDGSLLFVAFGTYNEVVIYILDGMSGEIRRTLHDLSKGAIRDIQLLSSCLIVLSDDLAVYDLVTDELRYGLRLDKVTGSAAQMTQLAVDDKSESFAVSVPILTWSNEKLRKGAVTELAVFGLNDNQPQLLKTVPHLITRLLPAGVSPGFIALDSAAQIWPIIGSSDSVTLAQPLADLNLEDTTPANGKELSVVLNGEIEETSDQEDDAMDIVEDENYDIHAAVVAPQRLTEIFDVAPAFAMPPIEDVFYRVAELFSPKPITTSSS